jgi:ribosomal-protein-alanine N-acetyltransferase
VVCGQEVKEGLESAQFVVQIHPAARIVCFPREAFPRFHRGIPSTITAKIGSVEFTLRDADSRDFETLWRIDQQCFVPEIAYSQRELATYMSLRGAFTLVAVDPESNIVGFLVATTRRSGVGHVITIDVSTDVRRLGVGSLLIDAAEERLRKQSCHTVSLETAVDNQSALFFYKQHGYFTVKTVPRYYSNGVDALVLQKDLLSTAQAS